MGLGRGATSSEAASTPSHLQRKFSLTAHSPPTYPHIPTSSRLWSGGAGPETGTEFIEDKGLQCFVQQTNGGPASGEAGVRVYGCGSESPGGFWPSLSVSALPPALWEQGAPGEGAPGAGTCVGAPGLGRVCACVLRLARGREGGAEEQCAGLPRHPGPGGWRAQGELLPPLVQSGVCCSVAGAKRAVSGDIV